jgi:hypothetical protein
MAQDLGFLGLPVDPFRWGGRLASRNTGQEANYREETRDSRHHRHESYDMRITRRPAQ